MKSIWFEYWGGMVDVKIVTRLPRKCRYLCSDEEYSYYDVDEDYIIAIAD